MSVAYLDFLRSKEAAAPRRGLESVPPLAPHLFAFQAHCVDFLLRVGSGGLFLDTGLGKTAVELEWCRHAAEATNGRALILTPLAVARQIEREGKRWGYEIRVIREQSEAGDGINVCNYDRLALLEPGAFGAVALDESSILKNFTGATSRALIAAFARHRFRLSATATPAPNDHMELGQHAAFCGIMPSNEMLMRWFISDQTEMGRYRLKRHGIAAFWSWMASWCRMAAMPSDLGAVDDGFVLPPLNVSRHRATGSEPLKSSDALFADVFVSATGMHEIKRQTSEARAEMAAGLVYDMAACGSPNTTNGDARKRKPILSTERHGTPRDAEETLKPVAFTCANGLRLTENTSQHIDEQAQRSETLDAGNATRRMKSIGNRSSRESEHTTQDRASGSVERYSCDPSDSQRTHTKASSSGSEGNARSVESLNSDCVPTIAIEAERLADCSATDATLRSDSSRTRLRHCAEPWIIWVDTDYEQDAVERAITRRLGGDSYFSVRGSDATRDKEDSVLAWCDGVRPIMISKPSILGFGMNFQHCARTIFVGRTFSYEAWYQAIRRLWRFGQTRPVECHLIVAAGEDAIGRVIDRKSGDHEAMKRAMADAMRRAMGPESAVRVPYAPTHDGRLPRWFAA